MTRSSRASSGTELPPWTGAASDGQALTLHTLCDPEVQCPGCCCSCCSCASSSTTTSFSPPLLLLLLPSNLVFFHISSRERVTARVAGVQEENGGEVGGGWAARSGRKLLPRAWSGWQRRLRPPPPPFPLTHKDIGFGAFRMMFFFCLVCLSLGTGG